MIVTGKPQPALMIGNRERLATHSSVFEPPGYLPPLFLSPSQILWFEYTVQADDRDDDGVSIGANAIRLNGGTIEPAVEGLRVDLTNPPLVADPAHKVDGSRVATPSVSRVFVRGLPESGDTYGLDETIDVDVEFTRPVMVTGGPQLKLMVGSRPRLADYVPGLVSPARSLSFKYRVQPGDRDTDGISIPAYALGRGGGKISVGDGSTDAVLTHAALGDDIVRKVDAARVSEPTVTSVFFGGSPVRGDTYGPGETIEVEVRFSRVVAVSGFPLVALRVGDSVRYATYSPGPQPSKSLSFRYIVEPGDRDTNGVSIAAGAVRLGGGAIQATDRATNAVLAHSAVGNDPSRKVQGGPGGPTVPEGECSSDAETACLQDSRFEVRAVWWTSDGRSGPAQLVPEGTNESGLFWFFDRDNWEILVKVLDGCSTNGHFWVFGAATTDLGFHFTVTDTVTGRARVYRHEPGEPAAAITDITAFADGCRR